MYWILKLIARAFSLLPERALPWFARAFAVLAFDVLRVRRRLVLGNLARALGPDESPARIALARQSYANFGLTVFEFLRGDVHDLAARVELRGAENAHQALQAGRGMFLLCLHLGNWEALGAKCSRALVPSHVLVKKVGSPGVNRFVLEIRKKNGFLAIERKGKGDGARAVLQALKRGEAVGFIMDQSRPGEPRLPFFGHDAKTNTGLATFWRRVQAPVVPVAIRRVGPGRHVAEFRPALPLTATDDAETDVRRLSTLFNQALEDEIRRAPEQYLWLHDRWK